MKATLVLLASFLAHPTFQSVPALCGTICKTIQVPYTPTKCQLVCPKELPLQLTEEEIQLAGKLDWTKISAATYKILPKLLKSEYEVQMENFELVPWLPIFRTTVSIVKVHYEEAAKEAMKLVDAIGKLSFGSVISVVSKVLPIVRPQEVMMKEQDVRIWGGVCWDCLIIKCVKVLSLVIKDNEGESDHETSGFNQWKDILEKGAMVMKTVVSQDDIYIASFF